MTESNPLFKPSNPYDTLRTLEEWVSETASHAGQSNQTAELDRRVRDKRKPPPLDAAKRAQQFRDGSPPRAPRISNDSNLRKKIVGPAICGLLTVILLGLAWQSYEDMETRKLIKGSLYAFTSSFGTTEQIPRSANQPQSPTAISVGVDEVNELKRQLISVVDDIDALRRDVEQLSTKHDRLLEEIAAVKVSQQNLSEKMSSQTQITATLPQTPSESPRRASAARRQTQKNTPTVVNANASKRPIVASPTTGTIGTASADEPPVEPAPRPPVPLPAATETPSPLH
jgi:hypothetical protein